MMNHLAVGIGYGFTSLGLFMMVWALVKKSPRTLVFGMGCNMFGIVLSWLGLIFS